jgi:hypothetical protein
MAILSFFLRFASGAQSRFSQRLTFGSRRFAPGVC